MKVRAPLGDVKIVALVRDANNRPVIDDGEAISEQMKQLLTESELKELKNDRFAFRRSA